MAAGKTTVGELAARRLHLPFRDLDQEIEAQAAATIAGLFNSHGEAEFRRLESDALRGLIAGPPAVIATGGGTPCFGDNLARMRSAGLVVALTAPLERLLPRVADASTRPLLAQTEREIRELYHVREPIYRQAHACVPTERRTPEGAARMVAQLAQRTSGLSTQDLASAVVVALVGRAYPVIVQPGTMSRLGALCRDALGDTAGSVGLVCDDNVAPLYAVAARRSLQAAGFAVSSQVVPAGETSKSFDTAAELAEKLAAAGLDRRSAIVALGGGVVGDLAGYVAS
jgi:shikimate kinase/3-dehydroquinate synthase